MHLIKGRNQIFRYAIKKRYKYIYILCIYTEFIKSIIIIYMTHDFHSKVLEMELPLYNKYLHAFYQSY